ncbi:efflux RND transporter permease subunit [Asticcacaulis sp. EMRT-3]|uniref:efflux RND transporter permease subunit n=1 Tax=Asticcacaulis sp. EMRT-3 TaxID=3040349 RepID=UPI0024AEBABC|nr:efflux RND transporter permease subunit [Asticcacaulis sp. EMRT-3]MDI7775087.1 efflux RND transporter permease subunit [Asticcacaulis sp. EMRT-3]
MSEDNGSQPSHEKKLGLSGRLTKATLRSPLTPLFLIVAILVGLLAVMSIPREEEPQISVPMIDISVAAPGMKAVDAEQLIAKPLETIVKSINDVDHVYSFIDDDKVLVTARFKVGTDPDNAAIRVQEKLSANMDRLPVGIAPPLVQTRGINDVPAMIITLSPKPGTGNELNDTALYNLAEKLRGELAKVENVGLTFIVGGRPEEIRIEPDAAAMTAHGVSLDALMNAVKGANTSFPAGSIRQNAEAVSVTAGQTLQTATDVGMITVPSVTGDTVLVRDVATVVQAPREDQSHVFRYSHLANGTWVQTPAVSLAIAKRKGANAVVLSGAVLQRVESLKGSLIPDNVQVSVTRDYGHSANDKANELLFHLALATVSIVILIGFTIGWREAGVTAVVIPTTILLTMFASYLMGYTINRVSLFALIFSIGILVDDAIVMIENISRHWGMNDGRSRFDATVDAVAEVGNPTVIATLTVVAALLPMLFVSGLMGPYMAPIPVNASAAMIFSFFVAVILAPWLMIRFARKTLKAGEHAGHAHDHEGFIGVIYRRVASSIIKDKKSAGLFLAAVGIATLLACSAFYFKAVTVKLLPFDNKSELQVIADLPRGTSLETTQRILNQAAQITTQMKEVEAIDSYAGTAAPFNFNGLVRHYYFRTNPEQGDLNILLAPKDKRSRESHAIAIDLRNRLKAIALPAHGVLKVVEAPPGPPVMATLLAEVYGPDAATRRTVAEKIKAIYKSIPYIVDVDDSYGVAPPKLAIVTNRHRLEALNVSDGQVYASLSALMNGQVLGYSDRGDGRDPLEISLRLPQSERTYDQALQSMPVAASTGPAGTRLVSLGEVTTATQTTGSTHIYRRDGRNVDMIMGEMAGKYEAPIYGILAVDKAIKNADWGKLPTPAIRLHGQPEDESHATVLWDGEWEITWVTFRDMGAAFGVALLGIYVLVVGQFKSFKLPLVILTPVPLTLIGIVIGHMLFHAPFTATSMIGFIALAGIIVRNSILLVDFIRHADKYDSDGHKRPLQAILLDAGATRFKPILLTALAAMIGASVILTDPIFQGLAISLLFGLFSSTLLTVLVIPAIYVVMRGDSTVGDSASKGVNS